MATELRPDALEEFQCASVSILAARLPILCFGKTAVLKFLSSRLRHPIRRSRYVRDWNKSQHKPESNSKASRLFTAPRSVLTHCCKDAARALRLITTKGFQDVLAIGRQARPELYNLNAVRPPPLVPDELRFGLRERVSATGDVLERLDEKELAALVGRLKELKVEAIAICLLFSFVHPQHEEQIARAVSSLNRPVSVSHLILPEYREFERTSTVAINAYLQPMMGNYLKRLETNTPHLRVMQSSGGSISASGAAAEPVRTILSGPAGGVVGALRTARAAGFEKVITFDMGGTSTDVALCERDGVRSTNEAVVAGLPVAVPVMDIHTVGAGGGSIARVDEGGSLRVGPESAGADPGPACYGRGLLPTVTDAHVVLGPFWRRRFVGWRVCA